MAVVEKGLEQRVILHNVRWETYECLLADHEDSSAPRFTYDRGELEIAMLSPEHERLNRLTASLVEMAAEAIGVEFDSLGSTTFRLAEAERGFEPDSCFYMENAARIRGKNRIDLRVDPPPDLVVEIDITSPSIPKLPIYARFGVPEVWRYDGSSLEIMVLKAGEYIQSAESRALPGVSAEAMSDLIERGKGQQRLAWLRGVREWARGLATSSGLTTESTEHTEG